MDEVVKKLQQRFDAPEDKLSYEIIGAAIEVHRTLGGPGLMESVYRHPPCCQWLLTLLLFLFFAPLQLWVVLCDYLQPGGG
jgi:hypothetical protein